MTRLRSPTPKPAHRGGEIFGARQHEAQFRVRRREVGLKVDVLGAGDVALLEILAPGLHRVADVGVGDQVDRAIEDAQFGVVEMGREPLALDQKLGMGKALARRAHISLHCCRLIVPPGRRRRQARRATIAARRGGSRAPGGGNRRRATRAWRDRSRGRGAACRRRPHRPRCAARLPDPGASRGC